MKKALYFIFTCIVILSIYIINNNLNSSSQGEKVNLIIATKSGKNEDEVHELVFEELKTMDLNVDVKVKGLESDVSNIFTVDIKTSLNEDEIIDKLLKIRDFKYVQVNYDLKTKSK